jgi:hypothetical protein
MDKFVFLLAVTSVVITGLVMFSNTMRRRHQNQMHNRLLDKFTSAQDLSVFLQSPGGREYVSNLTDALGNPLQAIVSSVRSGVIACIVGAGCFVPYVRDLDVGFPIKALGVLLVFLGTGFIVSAGVTYQLSRRLQLIPPRDDAR